MALVLLCTHMEPTILYRYLSNTCNNLYLHETTLLLCTHLMHTCITQSLAGAIPFYFITCLTPTCTTLCTPGCYLYYCAHTWRLTVQLCTHLVPTCTLYNSVHIWCLPVQVCTHLAPTCIRCYGTCCSSPSSAVSQTQCRANRRSVYRPSTTPDTEYNIENMSTS